MIKSLKQSREDEGFTLIELLIVIVIIGILSAVVVFAVGGIQNRGNNSACKANLEVLNTAAEAFKANDAAGQYPATFDAMVPSYIKNLPAATTASGLNIVVAPTGGATYTLVYTPATGTTTATCPAG